MVSSLLVLHQVLAEFSSLQVLLQFPSFLKRMWEKYPSIL